MSNEQPLLELKRVSHLPKILPNPEADGLTTLLSGIDHTGEEIKLHVTTERPLTLFLNGQEIVTMMTIGDHPEYLAHGYLINQGMLKPSDVVEGFDYDEELGVIIVRTAKATNFEAKLKKKTLTSGCAQGTVFGDLMEQIEDIKLGGDLKLPVSKMIKLLSGINQVPSLYLKAGAIHGCALLDVNAVDEADGVDGDITAGICCYFEDIGRHNAVDKTAGYMAQNKVDPTDKVFFTTGRLTSEMVIKTVQMGIPILVSRSGFTAWGVELAQSCGLTLIGRAKGKRFTLMSGAERVVFDQS
ncbi:MAG: formate dehydrogenase accessory sulfurtransferase FdhD [Alphaproteobacteria bacterium]